MPMFWKSNSQCYKTVAYVGDSQLLIFFSSRKYIYLCKGNCLLPNHTFLYTTNLYLHLSTYISSGRSRGTFPGCPLLSQVTALYHAWHQLTKFHVKNEERVFPCFFHVKYASESFWKHMTFFFFCYYLNILLADSSMFLCQHCLDILLSSPLILLLWSI